MFEGFREWVKYISNSVVLYPPTFEHKDVGSLTSSLFSTSNQREIPGRGWVRISVVRSIQRLWNTKSEQSAVHVCID